MTPWARITEPELAAIATLPRRELVVWIAIRLRARNGWAIKRRELERLTGLGKRHVLLALSQLERRGFLARAYSGERFDPWGRFVAEAVIPEIPATVIPPITEDRSPGSRSAAEPGSQRSRYTFQGSDQRINGSGDPKIDHVRSFDQGVQGERTNERVERLVRTALELWPEMARSAARRFVERLADLAGGASGDELEHFMRNASSDPTVARADIPLAVVCTRDRWDAWTRRRRRGARAPERSTDLPSGDRLTPSELAELATAALK